jgi:chaperonin GroEL
MRLRYYLEEGMKLILNELSKLTVQVEGKESLAQIALSICYDPSLAKLMGEIFDIIGQYGILDIRTGRGRHLEREYVEGIYWDNGVITRDMITDPVSQKVELENVAVLISNLSIDDPQSLLPIFESVLQADIHSMLIFGSEFSGTVIGLLMAANKDPSKFRVIGVKTLGVSLIDQTAAMQDLAVLTGGQPRVKAAGDTLNGLTFIDLGQVRKVRAGYHYVSLFGGKGDPRQLRAHLTSLHAAFDREEDLDQRKKIQKRIGKLMGGSATLWIGAATETEITYRQELAERTADAVRAALREGVLPGGGVALLACRPVLSEKFHQSTEPDERAAYQILIKTMEAPIRAILTNAGLDASDVMAELRLAGDNRGYNVMTGKIVNMMEAGIFDVAAVVKSALRGAISSAALALTTDILIHHKKPVQALEP